jgi:uncharacterized membrane protein YoaK (UPF0700 family)
MAVPTSAIEQVKPTDIGLALLAVASGSSDAISYLSLGKVFTSAMTGNTALLGIAIGQRDVTAALEAFSALAGFILGAAVAAATSERRNRAVSLARALRSLFAIELACLALFALIWSDTGHPVTGARPFALIILSAAAMGVQSVVARNITSARNISPSGINTVVFTSTLVSIVEKLVGALVRHVRPVVDFRTWRLIGIFFAYAIGAIAAVVLVQTELAWVALVPIVAVLGALGICEVDGRASMHAP